jgi:poly-gamma-glutamate capsule biosynthesis protein CapA/YwtB (metallophosphatase superfamily)
VDDATTLVLAGDVMTGRGVDQILAEPGSPRLRERYVVDARSYVELAEQANGPIPSPVSDEWPWGDALAAMDDVAPAVRVMNLETGVTSCEDFAVAKGIHYRMSPANLGSLAVARVDAWALANNHVLDHGTAGLLETLEVLRRAGLRTTGAGRDADAAWAPVTIPCADHRVVVLSVAHVSSGVPPSWAAGQHHPGVALLPDLSEATAEMVADATRRMSRSGDIRVVSVHWGGNWGYDVPREQRRFAHRLVDAGVHVLHGHSSHHPRPVEIYHDAIVLYGCGDLVNDYEGIGGYERFRDDLRLLHVVRLAPGSGRVERVTLVPFQARRMRLWRAATEDASGLARTISRISRPGGTGVRLCEDGSLEVSPHA